MRFKSGAALALLLSVTACGGGGGGGGGSGGSSAAGGGGGAGGSGGGSGGAAAPDVGTLWAVDTLSQSVEIVVSASGTSDTVLLDAGPEHVAYGAGAGWVTTNAGKILRIGSSTHAIDKTIDLGVSARSIVADANAVWISDDGDGTSSRPPKVSHLDPTSNTITASFEVTAVNDQYHELALGPGGLYLQIDNTFAVARIDPATNSVKETLPLGQSGGYGYGAITTLDDKVWVNDEYAHFLYRLAGAPLAVEQSYPIDKRFDGSMAAGASFVFVEDTNGQKIGAFNPQTGALDHEIDVGDGIRDIAVSHGYLVVAVSGNNVLVMDPANGHTLNTLLGVFANEFSIE